MKPYAKGDTVEVIAEDTAWCGDTGTVMRQENHIVVVYMGEGMYVHWQVDEIRPSQQKLDFDQPPHTEA